MKKAPEVRPGLDLREGKEGVSLAIRVQPRASRDGILGVREGALVVRLKAPPVEGAANEALCRILGRAFGVPPSSVRIAQGASGRNKVVLVSGVTADAVEKRLLTGPEGPGRS